MKLHIGFQVHIYIRPLLILKVKVMHISNIFKMEMLLLTSNVMLHVGFRLVYLVLTVAYSKGQFRNWNGVSPNILVFVLLLLVDIKLKQDGQNRS